MSDVKLVWATPSIDEHLAYIARVSNPAGQENPSIEGLLRYMEREGHVSPFTMANVCYEVNTTRDIGRQMLRHWTIMPQEFSQRYADVRALGDAFVLREFRLQDPNNRQASIPLPADDFRHDEWEYHQKKVLDAAKEAYAWALENGGAKECARVVLPEGNTKTRMYMNANVRSLVHYLRSRLHESTQKEHQQIAQQILAVFRTVAPVTARTFFPE